MAENITSVITVGDNLQYLKYCFIFIILAYIIYISRTNIKIKFVN